MELTTTSPEFVAWLAACQDLINKHYADSFAILTPPTLTAEEGGKVIKIVSNGSQRMVYAFVAKVDNHTKGLGDVKCGDVLKPATWKQPAKHARGNLFDAHKGMSEMGPHGPAYLKR